MGAILIKLLGWIGVVALIAVLIVVAICAASVIVTVFAMAVDACGEAIRKWRADRAKR